MTVISRLAGRLLRLPRPITKNVRVERGLAVTMPDGPALLMIRARTARPAAPAGSS